MLWAHLPLVRVLIWPWTTFDLDLCHLWPWTWTSGSHIKLSTKFLKLMIFDIVTLTFDPCVFFTLTLVISDLKTTCQINNDTFLKITFLPWWNWPLIYGLDLHISFMFITIRNLVNLIQTVPGIWNFFRVIFVRVTDRQKVMHKNSACSSAGELNNHRINSYWNKNYVTGIVPEAPSNLWPTFGKCT